MDDFMIDETTNTLTKYDPCITQGHVEYLLIPHFFRGKQIDSIAPYCFEGVQVESLTVGDGVQELKMRAFENSHCYNVNLPDGLEIKEHCFMNSRLREITLPNDITSIKPDTFVRCMNLVSIHGGSSSVKDIGDNAFAFCKKLSKLQFYNLRFIGDSVFIGCSGLNKIELGNNIQHLGKYLFYGCDNLTDITLTGSFDRLEAATFLDAKGLKHLTLSTSADSLYIPPHCFDDTSLEEITFLGDFEPIVKERSCFPKNILIRTASGSRAMNLGYYFPIKPL